MSSLRDDLAALLVRVPRRVVDGDAGLAVRFKDWCVLARSAVRDRKSGVRKLSALIADHAREFSDG